MFLYVTVSTLKPMAGRQGGGAQSCRRTARRRRRWRPQKIGFLYTWSLTHWGWSAPPRPRAAGLQGAEGARRCVRVTTCGSECRRKAAEIDVQLCRHTASRVPAMLQVPAAALRLLRTQASLMPAAAPACPPLHAAPPLAPTHTGWWSCPHCPAPAPGYAPPCRQTGSAGSRTRGPVCANVGGGGGGGWAAASARQACGSRLLARGWHGCMPRGVLLQQEAGRGLWRRLEGVKHGALGDL